MTCWDEDYGSSNLDLKKDVFALYPMANRYEMERGKIALTPMIPPIELYRSNLSDTAPAVAATTIDVMITILTHGG